MATKEELLADKRLVSVTNLTKYTEGLKNYLKETPYIEDKHLKTRNQLLATFDFYSTDYRVGFEMTDSSSTYSMYYDLSKTTSIDLIVKNKGITNPWTYKFARPENTSNPTETIATQEWANKRFIDVSTNIGWDNSNRIYIINPNSVNAIFNIFNNVNPNNFSYYGIYAAIPNSTINYYYYFAGRNEQGSLKFISYDGVYTLSNSGAVEYKPFAAIN